MFSIITFFGFMSWFFVLHDDLLNVCTLPVIFLVKIVEILSSIWGDLKGWPIQARYPFRVSNLNLALVVCFCAERVWLYTTSLSIEGASRTRECASWGIGGAKAV